MSEIKKILVPTDFSVCAEVALKYVAHITNDRPGKEVTFLHVHADANGQVDALENVKRTFKSLSDASCNTIAASGSLNEEVLRYQKQIHADLIVMGTKGAEENEVETNTSRLVLEADCPVLVVPDETSHPSISNVALALGKDAIDDTFALGVLHSIAREHDAKVHILTIDNQKETEIQIEDKNESVLEYYLETLDYRHSFPKNADIEKGIEQYIRKNNIDLLAILPRNHAKKSEPSEGRLTKLLTIHSKVPVLTID